MGDIPAKFRSQPQSRDVNEQHKFGLDSKKRVILRTLDGAVIPNNTFEFVKTTVTTSATQIICPENAGEVTIIHYDNTQSVFLKKDNTVAVTDFPFKNDTPINVALESDDNNNLWAIVAGDDVDVWVYTFIKE